MDEKTLKATVARIAIVLGALAGSTESAQAQVMEEFFYDALGRLVSVVPADGRQYKFEYDRAGNWTATGPATGTSPKPDTPTPVDPTPKLFERTITVPASSGQLNTLRRLAEYAAYSGRQRHRRAARRRRGDCSPTDARGGACGRRADGRRRRRRRRGAIPAPERHHRPPSGWRWRWRVSRWPWGSRINGAARATARPSWKYGW